MDVSRIEILTSLPEPHFDDEATIVTARQVVPLEIAETSDRRRQTVILLSLLVAAALFGALVAVALNYFERRESVSSAIAPPATTATNSQVPQPSSTVSLATSAVESPSGGSAAETSSSEAEDTAANSPKEKVEGPAKPDDSITERRKVTSADPRQLVRPRRVHLPKAQTTSARSNEPKRGAGRIQDIFTGPNP